MGSDRVFTEAMADWVRYYRVCTNPAGVLDRRYGALRGGRNYGKYAAGANFVDFMTQNYGEGTIYRILQGYAKHHGKVWENVFGKTFDGLVDEWRQMETIYDPVFQWTYTGTAEGKRRWDGKFCGLRSVAAKEASDKSGAWIDGATAGRVNNVSDGSLAIALNGRFPSGGNPVAIASLGAAKEGSLLKNLGETVSSICRFLCTWYVCTAVISLADRMGDAEMSAKALKARKMLMTVWILSIVLEVISVLLGALGASDVLNVVSAILGLVAIVVSIIAYILYLKML